MTERSPLEPAWPSGCSSSALSATEVDQLAVEPTATFCSKGEDDREWDDGEWDVWESDWTSDWESDWESGGEKDPFVEKYVNKMALTPNDSQPKILKLKSMKTLTGDDSNSPAREQSSDGDTNEVDDDSTDSGYNISEEEADDSFNSGKEATLAHGLACHYCKKREVKQKATRKVQCSRCARRFCGPCLQNRNGEKVEVEAQAGVKWVCPKCRTGGCGPGCENCCICAPCRRRRGLPATGKLIGHAKLEGFHNVHDFLIHLKTNEPPEKIAQRKEGRGWTKAGGAMSARSPVGMLKPAQFWADCDTFKQKQIDIQRNPFRSATSKEGTAWTSAGRCATSSCSPGAAAVGMVIPGEFYADCVTAKQSIADMDDVRNRRQAHEKFAKGEEGEARATASGAMTRSKLATVAMLKRGRFWVDRAHANQAAVKLDTQQTPEKSANGNEVNGLAQAGSTTTGSRSTGELVGILEPARLCVNRAPDKQETAELYNEPTRQQKGLAWTMPPAVGDLWNSKNNVNRMGTDQEGASPRCGDVEKTEGDVPEVVNGNDSEHGSAVKEHRRVLDQILGRETQFERQVRRKLSLDQVMHRLSHSDDQACHGISGPLLRGLPQIRRDRKHRRMGRILEPSKFRKRKSKSCLARNIVNANPGFYSTAKMDEELLQDQSSEAAAGGSAIMPEKKSTFQPANQYAHDSHHHRERPSFNTPIRFKRPVTSLQALRKMGVLPKRNNADITAAQESAQKPGVPATAPPLVALSSDQTLKQSFPVLDDLRPSRSGSQAILMRHLEKRKKIELRSCLKPQNTSPADLSPAGPSAIDKNNLVAEVAAWRGELVRPSEKEPESGLGQLSQTRFVTNGFKFRSRHSGVQSGFESFSQKETVTGFGSFRVEGTGLSAVKS